MISHPKDAFNPASSEPQPIGMRYGDVKRPSEHTDKPTVMSWVTRGPEKLMCPGAASTQVDVLSDWMLQANLTIPDYPILAYDLIPLDGDITQWKAEGRDHFIEKFSNNEQARAAATRYPTASMKQWISLDQLHRLHQMH